MSRRVILLFAQPEKVGFQINLTNVNVNSQNFRQDTQSTTLVSLTTHSAKTLLPITAAKRRDPFALDFLIHLNVVTAAAHRATPSISSAVLPSEEVIA